MTVPRQISNYERRIMWQASNDDAGPSEPPPKPFFLTRFWRFTLPFSALWIGGWGIYLAARSWS